MGKYYLFLQSNLADKFMFYQRRSLRLVLNHVFGDTGHARTVFCWTESFARWHGSQ